MGIQTTLCRVVSVYYLSSVQKTTSLFLGRLIIRKPLIASRFLQII